MNKFRNHWIFFALCAVSFVHSAEPVAKFDRNSVDLRIESWQPTKAERAFDEIAWANSLSDAERLAKEKGRAIFLFTYDGTDLACFRC